MARDLLAPPFTVASESTFSIVKQVLTDTRTCLSSETIEMGICTKNLLDAEMRSQNKSVEGIIEDTSEDE